MKKLLLILFCLVLVGSSGCYEQDPGREYYEGCEDACANIEPLYPNSENYMEGYRNCCQED
ncbi:hypothetical protein ACFL2J_06885 [Candidatus Omnitrophota bacterium]